MKKKAFLVAAGLCFWLFSSQASAQASGFGIGLMVGEPNGLTLKFNLTREQALDFRVGLQFNNVLDLQGNYLISPFVLANTGDIILPAYFGIGGRMIFVDAGNNDILLLGARVPFGLALQFTSAPVEIFAELGFSLFFINDVDVDIDGVVGFHFFF